MHMSTTKDNGLTITFCHGPLYEGWTSKAAGAGAELAEQIITVLKEHHE